MKKTALLKPIFLASAALLLLAGCVYRERMVYRQPLPGAPVVAEQEVVVTGVPPPPVVETVTIAPGPGFIWIGGGWVWRDHWVWERGHWGRPPHRSAVWVPHRYVYRNGTHVFVRGGWR